MSTTTPDVHTLRGRVLAVIAAEPLTAKMVGKRLGIRKTKALRHLDALKRDDLAMFYMHDGARIWRSKAAR